MHHLLQEHHRRGTSGFVSVASYPARIHPRVPLIIPPTVEALYIKATEYGEHVPTENWLARIEDYLCHVLMEASAPCLRLFVWTHDVQNQKWARREMMADNADNGFWHSRSFDGDNGTPLDTPSISLHVVERCDGLGVQFVYTNNPDLYHVITMT